MNNQTSKFGIYFLLFTLSLLIISCQQSRFDVDVDEVEIDQKLYRMEKELLGDVKNIGENNRVLYSKYGSFYQRYVENVMNFGSVQDASTVNNLYQFANDKYVKEVYVKSQLEFEDFSKQYNELNNAFRRYSVHFPDRQIPNLVTYISGFQYAIMLTDSVLGIGLDMYFGNDYEHYPGMGYPMYKVKNLSKEYIIPNAIKGWVSTEFDDPNLRVDMLGEMLWQGKMLFLLDVLIPNQHDTIKTGFSEAQLDWCENNEFQIWAHLVNNELLYSSDKKTISGYFAEGPFTSGFPQESPANAVAWLGWQIIAAFMEENTKFSLDELMNSSDAKAILKRSKYKPNK